MDRSRSVRFSSVKRSPLTESFAFDEDDDIVALTQHEGENPKEDKEVIKKKLLLQYRAYPFLILLPHSELCLFCVCLIIVGAYLQSQTLLCLNIQGIFLNGLNYPS